MLVGSNHQAQTIATGRRFEYRLVLIAIKLVHTVIWAFFAACLVAIPIAGLRGRLKWALVPSAFVLLECGVLAINHGRCPLTDAAARYTRERAANFDIYLPEWLARDNRNIFGTLFLAGELIVLWLWRSRARLRHKRDLPC